jgi:hypothetical protein
MRGESPSRDDRKKSITDVLEKRFPAFDYEDIEREFGEQGLRDLEFQKRRILRAHTHVLSR